MTGAAIVAGGIWLILMAGRLIHTRVKLCMVHGLLHGRRAVRLMLALLRCGGMAVARHRLHGDRNSQRIAAE